MEKNNGEIGIGQNSQLNNQSPENVIVKRSSDNDNLITISDVIKKAGGISSLTDLSRRVFYRYAHNVV